MKRQQDRDSPVKIKRSHSSVSRYDDSPRDRSSPDRRDRRVANKSPNDQRRGRTRDSSAERGVTINRSGNAMGRDSYDDYSRNIKSERGPPPMSKVLCVSNLNHKVGDAPVRDALLREFNRFGDVNVKIFHSGNERVAYVYFRTFEDARDARHAKARLVLFDKPVQMEPMFDRGLSNRRNRSISPDYGGIRGVSPAHSSASNNSMGRHALGSARQNAVDRNPGYSHPRDGMRRDMHNDFHHHNIHRRDDSKKEKFPNYLHHVPPEEDDKATRTLFVGNLEVTISEAELRRIFERYGVVEDIDVKRPAPGLGNAYAFIKFLNLDMAHRGKVEMSGQYIGKFQCKIGYGKATPTTRIWVGGLGPWTSLSHLEREFDRFGAIRKIDFVKGENHAYIQYDSIDAAQAACQEMRGFPLGGQDKRLRVDFADPGPYNSNYRSPSRTGFPEEEGYVLPSAGKRQNFRTEVPPATDDYYGTLDNSWSRNSLYDNQSYDPLYDRSPKFQGREPWGVSEHEERHDYRGWNNRNHQGWWDDHPRGARNENQDRRKRGRSPEMDDPTRVGHDMYYKRPRSRSPERNEFERSSLNKETLSPRRNRSNGGINRRMSRESHLNAEGRSDFRKDYDYDSGKGDRNRRQEFDKKRIHDNLKDGVIVAESVDNLQDLAKCCPVAWQGGLVLKNSAFPTRMHVCSGDPSLVDYMMKDLEVPMLRITQRLRLDPPKLDDVSRRISCAGSHGYCLLLTFPGPIQPGEDQSAAVQTRPLRNLVSYLKQKEAAGVISLPCNSKKDGKDANGVMYAFPPCSFALDLLRRIAPNISSDSSKEDHLVVVVVKGSS
ncbi:RNA-binding protein spenito-like [Uloborus diversus]|uniref:RNA-binding protein spenito-like n=1 Tax=Uloborus diversus TaxID=327109 RepID=UPI0024093B90|nr:RNA-binding protein spenito-like [Uloborus diversus]